jgi:rubredoxin
MDESCSMCGRVADPAAEGDPPLAWSTELIDAGTRWICPACTRDHVRSIEAKLDQAWW